MRKVVVELAMLVRQTKTVIVAVPDNCSATDDAIAAAVWRADDGHGFEDDNAWGCQEGTHDVFIPERACAPDYRIATRNGSTVAVRAARKRSRVATS